jgi:uncharacterized protein (TIGR03437 family)
MASGCALALLVAHLALAQPTNVDLANPGFEAPYNAVSENGGKVSGSIANGWADNSVWSNAAVQYSQETNNPHRGASCQQIEVSSVGSGEAQLVQTVAVRSGSLYTGSIWMRGPAGTHVTFRIQGATPPYAFYLDTAATLVPDWQQFTIQGYIATDVLVNVMIAFSQPGTACVDDVRLSYTPGTFAPTPNLGPISPSFFGIHVANYLSNTLSNPGLEPPFVSTGVNTPISGNIALAWSDNSSWADVTVTYREDTINPHGGVSSQEVDVQAVRSGAVQLTQLVAVIPGRSYTMTAWLRGQPGATVNLVLQQAAAPYTYYAFSTAQLSADWKQFQTTGQVNDSKILLMFQATSPVIFSVDDVAFTDSNGLAVTNGVPWPAARFGTLRLWDSGTAWTALEPLKGLWNFAPLDTWVAAAEANGIPDIILTLGQTPAWASSDPSLVNYVGAGAPAPPVDNQDWRDYISAVATRYKGRIRYYEIWNEPNDTTYFTGTVAQLVELTREAYKILKAADPKNTVISPAAYSAGYLDSFLAAGAAPHVDVIGHHFYTTPPEDTGVLIANVRLVLAKYGLSAMPLWDTEGASGDTTTPSDLAAAYMVRKYLTDLAFGSGRYDWYTWGPATDFCVGTEQTDPRSLTKAGQAYRYLFDWLLGASLTQATIDSSGTWQVGLTLATGDQGLIVWNPNQNQPFTIPADINARTIRDIFGKVEPVQGSQVAVTNSPVLLSSCCQDPPVVNAVENAASNTSPVSAGSLATIYGTGLASEATKPAGLPLPLELGSVSAFINGASCPMLYADSGQINFQVPFEAQAGGATLFLRSPRGISQEYPLTIDPAAPGVFQISGNRAVATNAAGALITPSAPALAGSVIVVYLTGIGSLTTTPLDGDGAPVSPLARATLPATATIGGVDAPIEFLGLTPFFVGLAQANLVVPQLATGNYPLVIAVNGVASAPVMIPVAGRSP